MDSDQEYSNEPLLPTGAVLGVLKPFPPLPKSMDFTDLVYTIELCIVSAIDSPYTFEQLHGSSLSSLIIRPLVKSLLYPNNESTGGHSSDINFADQHRGIVAALIVARQDFLLEEEEDLITGYIEKGLSEARAAAAEIIAARFLYHVRKDSDRIAFLTYVCENEATASTMSAEEGNNNCSHGPNPSSSSSNATEATPLLNPTLDFPIESRQEVERKCCLDQSYESYSALELAVIHEARSFLCSGPVESLLIRLWNGNIVYWDSIKADSVKKVQIYDHRSPRTGMFARLRVPMYRSLSMMSNYAILLILFYALLFKQQSEHSKHADTSMTVVEALLHVWFAGFVLDEVTQMREAGSLGRYIVDYWSIFDLTIISVYMVFVVFRVLGHASTDYSTTQHAFDILSLEALLLVPRFFSFLAIFPYFGTLLPCLKTLAKEFIKFLTLILIIYLGFFTTFAFLGRNTFTVHEMSWLLVSVFFGNASTGFDAAPKISPEFGPWLMLIFVTLTNILLVTVLVSIMSQRFSSMMKRAREEYLFLFASTVVEHITTADRLTYFYPPINLLSVLIRPVRLFLNHHQYRQFKVAVLIMTHWPWALAIYIYESIERYRSNRALRNRRIRTR